MKKKMSSRTRATVRTPVHELSSRDTIEHYNAVMFEELKGQMQIVIEGMESFRRESRETLDAFKSETNARFDLVDLAIKANSQAIGVLQSDVKGLKFDVDVLKSDVQVLKSDVQVLKSDVQVLKSDVQVLKSDVKEIRTEMKQMEDRLSAKIENVNRRVDNHETRITDLEAIRT